MDFIQNSVYDVVVVGGGAAGIFAATALNRRGKRVLIVEAADKLGGRCQIDWSMGCPIEVGAAASRIQVNEDSKKLTMPLMIHRGSVMDPESMIGACANWSRLEHGVSLEANKNAKVDTLSETKDTNRHEFNLVQSVKDVLSDNKPLINIAASDIKWMEWFEGMYEIRFASSLEHVSKTVLSTPQNGVRNTFQGFSSPIPYGFSTWLADLAKDIDVKLNSVVSIIDYSSSMNTDRMDFYSKYRLNSKNLCVTLKDGSHIWCASCVLTVSVGVLQDESMIRFIPELPARKRAVIRDCFGMGIVNKVALCFEHVFWDKTVDVIGALPLSSIDPVRKTPLILPITHLYEDSPVLSFLVGGEAALEIETSADHRSVQLVLESLSSLLTAPKESRNGAVVKSSSKRLRHRKASDSIRDKDRESVKKIGVDLAKDSQGKVIIPQPISTLVTHWGRNPYIRGSHSYLSLQATGDEPEILAQPIGHCLFFAGEATHSREQGTLEGAMLSGIREARRICGESIDRIAVNQELEEQLPTANLAELLRTETEDEENGSRDRKSSEVFSGSDFEEMRSVSPPPPP